MFNNPESACRTCGGIGTHKLTHPDLLIPDPRRSIIGAVLLTRRSSTTSTRGMAG